MVRLTGDIAIISGEQLSEYLLCLDCERRFGAWERYVAEKVAQQVNGRFPGLDTIEPSRSPDDKSTRATDASALDLDKIVSFVASIFWRASVSSAVADLSLGAKYDEEFRNYLRGEEPFPQNVRLFFQLLLSDKELPVDRVMAEPHNLHGDGHEFYLFAGCGMLMSLVVGDNFPPQYDDLCLARSGTMVIGPASPVWRNEVLNMFQGRNPVGKLAKA
jgi:hypothetical protein